MAQFNVGDVVVLKSGSDPMTVKIVGNDNKIYCLWYINGDFKGHEFPPDALKTYEAPTPPSARVSTRR